jgi:hypothetical protein
MMNIVSKVFRLSTEVKMIEAPYPELDDLLKMMGEAGRHLSEIEAIFLFACAGRLKSAHVFQ